MSDFRRLLQRKRAHNIAEQMNRRGASGQTEPDCRLEDKVEYATAEIRMLPFTPGGFLSIWMDGCVLGDARMERGEEADGPGPFGGGCDQMGFVVLVE